MSTFLFSGWVLNHTRGKCIQNACFLLGWWRIVWGRLVWSLLLAVDCQLRAKLKLQEKPHRGAPVRKELPERMWKDICKFLRIHFYPPFLSMLLLLLPSILHLFWSGEESLSVLNEMKSCQVNKTFCKDGKTWNHLTRKEKSLCKWCWTNLRSQFHDGKWVQIGFREQTPGVPWVIQTY